MGEGVIVGAAIVDGDRVLAARRSAPASMAGGWEFPGGKVEPGETDAQALVRECQEELGVTVRLGGRIGPDTPLPTGWVLRVWMTDIDPQPTVGGVRPLPLQDHDQLRWLPAGELASLEWLPADWPIVLALADHLLDPQPLLGGRVGGAVRVGDTVRRPSGPWTPAVHELMAHLRLAGVPAVPRPLGLDAAGKEVLRFVPGRTIGDNPRVPKDFRGPVLAAEVGAWLRSVHAATATFPSEERTWRRGVLTRRAGTVICHNDISPHNVVLDEGGRLATVLDWDMAAPGAALDDLAFAAWQFVLRHGEGVDEEAAGVAALAKGYDADPVAVLDRVGPRLRGAVLYMRRGAADGDVGLQQLLTTGIPEATEAGVVDLAGRRDQIAARLGGR